MSERLQLLEVAAGSGDEPIQLKYVYAEPNSTPYIACAVWTGRDPYSSDAPVEELSGITAASDDTPSSLRDAIRQLRDAEVPVYLWIEQLCWGTDNTSSFEQEQEQKGNTINDIIRLKEIYKAAKETVIWAGRDWHNAVEEEYLDALLGPETPDVVGHAFAFATRLADPDASASDIAQLLDERYDHSSSSSSFTPTSSRGDEKEKEETRSWAYLFRIITRATFRRHPLLRTNYAITLPKITVMAGQSANRNRDENGNVASIPLATLQTVSLRLWAAFPIPYFLTRITPSSPGQSPTSIMYMDKFFVERCVTNFGLPPSVVFARMRALFSDKKQNNEEGKEESEGIAPDMPRFHTNIGFCDKIYDIEGREWQYKAAMDDASTLLNNPVLFVEGALERLKFGARPPSLPYESETEVTNTSSNTKTGKGERRRIPRAEDQAPYIPTPRNIRKRLPLLRILPASSLSSPVECHLIEIPHSELPSLNLSFVTNNTFLRRTLPPPPPQQTPSFHGVHFPVPGRTQNTTAILVNGQAFVVPRLQELFLRLARENSTQPNPKHKAESTAEPEAEPVWLYLWNVCYHAGGRVGLGTREDMENYVTVKSFVKRIPNSGEMDMYAALDRAGDERARADLEALGLPAEMEWDEWLLELND